MIWNGMFITFDNLWYSGYRFWNWNAVAVHFSTTSTVLRGLSEYLADLKLGEPYTSLIPHLPHCHSTLLAHNRPLMIELNHTWKSKLPNSSWVTHLLIVIYAGGCFFPPPRPRGANLNGKKEETIGKITDKEITNNCDKNVNKMTFSVN